MSRKVYILSRISYGDFDAMHAEPIAVSEDKLTLISIKDDLNKKRTEADLIYEIHYEITGTCKLV